jgi:hypothetical protein
MRQLLTVLVLGSLLSACASLDDFQQMDTKTRTDFVCERDDQVENAIQQVQAAEQRLAEIETDLANGYKLVATCTTTTFELPPRLCTTVETNGQTVTTCQQGQDPLLKKVCTETPVGIDSQLEKQHRREYQLQHLQRQKQVDKAYMACFNKVGGMNAEQAYQHYKQN